MVGFQALQCLLLGRQSPERVAELLAAIAIPEQKSGFPDTTRLRTCAFRLSLPTCSSTKTTIRAFNGCS